MAWPEFGNGWQSPRISFSVNLSQTDRESPGKQKRSDFDNMNYSTEFEFCSVKSVNHCCGTDLSGTLTSADELFVDGKILPQSRAPESQVLSDGSHASLESSSPVRSASHNLSKTSGFENDPCKSARWPSIRWKNIFKLSNNDRFCRALKEAPDQGLNEGNNDVKNLPFGRSRWPFSRSGREKRGNCLFCALPFSRSKSGVERQSKPCCDASSYRSISIGAESQRKILLTDSKPFRISSLKREEFKKPPDLPKLKGSPERAMTNSLPRDYGRGSPGKRNERFMVRNSKSLAEGGSISMRVSPVVNMPALGI
ncbi:hypothetical protein SUGI_0121510 [Cryptomeria japonica]|uniref:uncharacterized protein LOC131071378 n=1 Tax=Cryptomeria japonica TaxID=3369 RepID=UPI002408E4D3|nr:uncharacterized protein LOC131071378 [Cryptomeria japonica]XP_057863174.1 uncharacterized protein LOC131071378 [Cryptomeria japonica]GLJ10075.1 hypothetical protein SUGI_0121510 [Cryptomeria japonica]